MGFPIAKLAGRVALIGVMLGGGLLYAGLSQAQEVGDESRAELVAASGGPAAFQAPPIMVRENAAVDVREDDVAPADVTHASNIPAINPVGAADGAGRTPHSSPAGRHRRR